MSARIQMFNASVPSLCYPSLQLLSTTLSQYRCLSRPQHSRHHLCRIPTQSHSNTYAQAGVSRKAKCMFFRDIVGVSLVPNLHASDVNSEMEPEGGTDLTSPDHLVVTQCSCIQAPSGNHSSREYKLHAGASLNVATLV